MVCTDSIQIPIFHIFPYKSINFYSHLYTHFHFMLNYAWFFLDGTPTSYLNKMTINMLVVTIVETVIPIFQKPADNLIAKLALHKILLVINVNGELFNGRFNQLSSGSSWPWWLRGSGRYFCPLYGVGDEQYKDQKKMKRSVTHTGITFLHLLSSFFTFSRKNYLPSQYSV